MEYWCFWNLENLGIVICKLLLESVWIASVFEQKSKSVTGILRNIECSPRNIDIFNDFRDPLFGTQMGVPKFTENINIPWTTLNIS